jgi:hypothetical protein
MRSKVIVLKGRDAAKYVMRLFAACAGVIRGQANE